MLIKTLHQIWIGDTLPDYAHYNQETFQKTNNEWQLVLWKTQEIEHFLKTSSPELFETFKLSNSKIAQADLARLYIIHHFGGLYADLDITFFRSVNPLFLNKSTVFFKEAQTGLITNSIFYSCPNAGCLLTALSAIKQIPNIINASDVLQFAGPEFLTNVVKQAKDVTIKSHIYFEHSPVKNHSFQYGYHKYAGSWL